MGIKDHPVAVRHPSTGGELDHPVAARHPSTGGGLIHPAARAGFGMMVKILFLFYTNGEFIAV